MKGQLIIIHGGTTFENYDDYIHFLENSKVTAEKFKTTEHWQNSLDKELGNDLEVFTPRMPNKNNANYREWCIWFERMIPYINDNVILLGYSLGGVFLMKYLSEQEFPKKIKALVLVAAPLDSIGLNESLGDFAPSIPMKDPTQTYKTYMVFSEDDPVVPFNRLAEYKKVLPDSEVVIFSDKGHFYQDTFPEIVQLIKNL